MNSKPDELALDFEGFFATSVRKDPEPPQADASFADGPHGPSVLDPVFADDSRDEFLEQDDHVPSLEAQSPDAESIGFAFAFNGGLNGSGIASINGNDVIAFNDLAELAGLGQFVVCTPAQGFSVRAGCDHLLPADAYPTLASMLAVEIGCKLVANPADPKGDCARSVRTLAAVYSRAESRLHALIKNIPDTPSRAARAACLRNQVWLGASQAGAAGESVAEIAADLNRPILRPSGAAGKRDITLRLQAGRAVQLQRLLCTPLPGVAQVELPATIASVQQSCRDGVPTFAQVSIRGARDAVADVFGKSFAPKGHSFWLGAEEASGIASGVNMIIERVLSFPDGITAGEAIGIDPGEISPLFGSSVSAGLACEAIIYSATEPDTSNSQLWTGFARSFVRSEMVREALEVGKITGVTVLEIGLTHVTISIPKQLLTRLRSYLLAAKTSLRMPTGWEWSA